MTVLKCNNSRARLQVGKKLCGHGRSRHASLTPTSSSSSTHIKLNPRNMNNSAESKRWYKKLIDYLFPVQEIKKEEVKKKEVEVEEEEVPGVEKRILELIKQQIVLKPSHDVSWRHVFGVTEAKKALQESIVWPLQRPDLFTGVRVPPSGLLLYGPPGTGKTLLCRCVASENGINVLNISPGNLFSRYTGESEKIMRSVFKVAEFLHPSLIIFDEIDAILSQRSDNDHSTELKVKNEFFSQLDGIETNRKKCVYVVGTTNRPDSLDEAVRRRLPRRIAVDLPNYEARREILYYQLRNIKVHLESHEVTRLIDQTRGYSAADVTSLCNEAALIPLRRLIAEEGIQRARARNIGTLRYEHFAHALHSVKPTVKEEEIKRYKDFKKQYGTFHS